MLYRRRAPDTVEVLVAHPGGPLWAAKDDGVWSVPKGLVEAGESEWTTALREFAEETGTHIADPGLDPLHLDLVHLDLGEVRLKSGKRVHGFGVEGDLDAEAVHSNTFEMMWPPRSGRMQSFPEIDRVQWCDPDTARRKLNPAQTPFVDRLLDALAGQSSR